MRIVHRHLNRRADQMGFTNVFSGRTSDEIMELRQDHEVYFWRKRGKIGTEEFFRMKYMWSFLPASYREIPSLHKVRMIKLWRARRLPRHPRDGDLNIIRHLKTAYGRWK